MHTTSNFNFLATHWKELYAIAIQAEQKAISEPITSLMYGRMSLEFAVEWMFEHDTELEKPYQATLNGLLAETSFKQQFNHQLYQDLHLIKRLGNFAAHNRKVSDADSLTSVEKLYFFLRWFAKSYSDVEIASGDSFNWNLIPKKEENKVTKRELDALSKKIDEELLFYKTKFEEEKAKREQLAAKNELQKKRQENEQEVYQKSKQQANVLDATAHPRDEKQTRLLLIDVMLREAGWDLEGVNDKEFKVTHMPTSTNASGTGYVDYVLWDDDGKPLALVEAKKALENARTGENQAQLYADALEKMFGQRPVMYYSNGYETYLWDDQFYKSARPVHGFMTKSELQTLIYRRNNRKELTKLPIDTAIAGRHYQMRAIRSIAEHISGKDKRTGKLIGTERASLLVLATGTGKTRTAIAFSKLMFEANWARRILFLADRISLVKQAKSNFVKLLPNHASISLLEQKDNPDARIVFSTYNTIMNLIDSFEGDHKRMYGVGHFDLIIIDEAHRSIYKKYQAIFDYFDAILLGLTATPKESIDHNTYKVFGLPDKSPTDAYTFEEAVKDGYLVPYRSIEVPTKFMTEGIKYEDLSEEEKEQFEEEILDGNEAQGSEWISESELNQWLFNIDTAKKTLAYILQHAIKKEGGDEIGKTIIFARNRKHAQFLKDMLLEMDKQQFGNDYVKVITHGEPKAQEFIERFCDEEKDRLPQIAISVDMMDTGIDAPSCVNLVFYKPVKSYAKFWQMIGRGSRLRPNLFGVGNDKERFLIFDLLGNFRFFNENPKGIETKQNKSITEVVFELRLQIATYLSLESFQESKELKAFRNQLLDELYNEVAALDTQRFDVKLKLKEVKEFGEGNRNKWNHLNKKEQRILINDIAPLIKPKENEHQLARFYDRQLYNLILVRLETPATEQFIADVEKEVFKVCKISEKLLRKTTIPQIKKKEDLIKQPLQESFWKNEGITHLDNLRKNVRDLLVYIEREDQRYVTTDFEDELDVSKITSNDMPGVTDHSTPTYTKTKSPFENTTRRLEELIRENKNNITIQRIRNGEAITKQELKQLENILFNSETSKEKLINELNSEVNLNTLIISLLGHSVEKVDEAFAVFINKHELNSIQISFLETIKKFLTTNGKIDPSKLYESPFKDFHYHGIDGIFNEQQADVIFEIINSFNKAE